VKGAEGLNHFQLRVRSSSLSLEVIQADTFLGRFLGLMGKKALPPFHGLLLIPCSSVHMCFMRFPIDVVYLAADGQVLKVRPRLQPWYGLSWCPGAWGVLELPAGGAEQAGIQKGEWLQCSESTLFCSKK